MFLNKKYLFLVVTLFYFHITDGQIIGEYLPKWTSGTLDIHEISTGRGSSTFFVFPDGTTMVYDAGEFTETNQKWRIPRYVKAKPDATKNSGEWISKYIANFLQDLPKKQIDYALISHFHWDHMGQITSKSPLSKSKKYKLSGITTLAENISIKKIIDRDFPNYNFPKEQNSPTMVNYISFLDWNRKKKGLQVERFLPGSNDQIILKNKKSDYPTFEIRNIASNGNVWTGIKNTFKNHYPELEDLKPEDYPSENMCSLALRLSYGEFDYFTGGDLRGVPPPGNPSWNDLETPIAKVVGNVEAALLNHHGHIDSQNSFFVSTLSPKVWLLSVWDSAHPGPTTYKRLQSTKLYNGSRDIFATGMHYANKLVTVGLDKLKSDNGHIVIRVAPQGKTFKVIIIDDSVEKGKVKAIYGPYKSN